MVQSERDLMDEVKRVCVSPVANRLASVLWRLHIAPLDCATSNHSRTGPVCSAICLRLLVRARGESHIQLFTANM